MRWIDHSVLRRTIAALVMLALSLAGLGRGLAASTDNRPASIVIGGFVVSLCHTDDGSGNPSDPQNSAHHDCCDLCTLHASTDVPVAPAFAPPARIAHFIDFDSTVASVFSTTRARTPRLSQGPPIRVT